MGIKSSLLNATRFKIQGHSFLPRFITILDVALIILIRTGREGGGLALTNFGVISWPKHNSFAICWFIVLKRFFILTNNAEDLTFGHDHKIMAIEFLFDFYSLTHKHCQIDMEIYS